MLPDVEAGVAAAFASVVGLAAAAVAAAAAAVAAAAAAAVAAAGDGDADGSFVTSLTGSLAWPGAVESPVWADPDVVVGCCGAVTGAGIVSADRPTIVSPAPVVSAFVDVLVVVWELLSLSSLSALRCDLCVDCTTGCAAAADAAPFVDDVAAEVPLVWLWLLSDDDVEFADVDFCHDGAAVDAGVADCVVVSAVKSWDELPWVVDVPLVEAILSGKDSVGMSSAEIRELRGWALLSDWPCPCPKAAKDCSKNEAKSSPSPPNDGLADKEMALLRTDCTATDSTAMIPGSPRESTGYGNMCKFWAKKSASGGEAFSSVFGSQNASVGDAAP